MSWTLQPAHISMTPARSRYTAFSSWLGAANRPAQAPNRDPAGDHRPADRLPHLNTVAVSDACYRGETRLLKSGQGRVRTADLPLHGRGVDGMDVANYDNAPHLSTFKGNNVRIVLRGQLKRLQNQFALSIGHRTGNLR
jgi:hypothetical protein